MLIKIGDFECTEVWDGVFYKALSNYPYITKWEIRNILDFMEYEKSQGRECRIECEDKGIIDYIKMQFKIRQNIKIFLVRILSPNVLPVLTEKAVKQNLFVIPLRWKMPSRFLSQESCFLL